MSVKYTFLTPSYKGRFIKDSVGSMLGQTYDDFSVIVSDDCSPEDLSSLISCYLDNPKLSYSRTESNIGSEHLVDHWNRLLDRADSEFVIIASDDDVYSSSFLENIEELVQKYPDCNLYHVRSRMIDADGKEMYEDRPCDEYMSRDAFMNFLLNPGSVLCIGNYVFRTAALKSAGGFVNFPLAWKSDTATQLLLSENGVATSSEVLFSFRSSGENTSSLKGNSKTDRLKIRACLEFRDWINKKGIGDIRAISKRIEGEMRSYYKALTFPEFSRMYLGMLKEGWFGSLRSGVSFVASYLL